MSEAIKWYKLAAEKGDVPSMVHIGVMYQSGMGVIIDNKKALKWYTRAAKRGLQRAQTHIAFMYEDGNGVTQDYVMVHMWFNIAGIDDVLTEIASENRDRLAKKMTPNKSEKAQALAKTCLESNYEQCP